MTSWAWFALAAFALLTGALFWRVRRELHTARARVDLLTEALDHADAGIALYDRDDRLVLASNSFRSLYPQLAAHIRPGTTFEQLAREGVAAGLVAGAKEHADEWLNERLRLHREGGHLVRQMPDGRRRRIQEQRLPGGGHLSFSIDITEQVHKSEALEAARAQAERGQQRLEELIEAIPAGFSLYDAEDRLILSNQMLREMWPTVTEATAEGQTPTYESMLRRNIASGAIAGVTEADADAYVEKRKAQRRQPFNQILIRNASHWLRTYEKRLSGGGIVSIWTDVTEGVTQRQAAESARARLQDAIDALPEGFALFDPDDRLVTCNAHYLALNPDSAPSMVVGNTFEAMLRFGVERGQYPEATPDVQAWIDERLARHRQPEGELMQQQPGNRWLRISERKTRDGGTATVITDVSKMVQREQALQKANQELDAARERLEQLSETDGLTGIANRRLLDRRLLEEWQRSRRLQQPMSLLIVDVDHFKRFNDRHGHLEGDSCLRRVARLLQTVLRRPTDLVARYGGEEFVILLAHTDLEGALSVARECLAVIDGAGIAHGDSPVAAQVTISVGCASCVASVDQGSAQDLLGAADTALFKAKQGGRHQVHAAP